MHYRCRSGFSPTVLLALLATQSAAADSLPDLEAFVDGVVGGFMAQQQIAGAEVAVVRDGEVQLVKGYGIDSVEPRRAVDPNASLFRIGSISKTFTWLSIMQLAERGKLRLEDPINDHLPDELDVPDEGFEQPIRIIDLMNHTAGFEDILQGLFVAADATPLPLKEQLRQRRPHRVREPGKFMVYSNYSTALAGAIVAHVSGMEYESYVEQNILVPLGLAHTTFREQYPPTAGLPQPMSAELAAHMAQNIESRNGAWQAIPHEHIVSMAPAGACVSTAGDMARYMLALLDPQRLEAAGVLKAETFAQMREPSFQSAPGMPAVHHGFFNTPLGTTTRLAIDNLSHGGSTLHFRSFMVVTDDLGGHGTLGVFVTANSASGATMVQAVAEQILLKYFAPAPQSEPTVPEGGASRAQEYAGQYRPARRAYTQFEALLNVGTINVTATKEGYLVIAIGGPPRRFVEIGQDLFRQTHGDATIAFVRNERGAVSHLVAYIGTVERVSFFASLQWLALLLGAVLLTGVGVLIAAALRREPVPPHSIGERRSAQVVTGTAIAWLAFIALLVAWGLPFAAPAAQDQFVYGYPQPLLKLALAVGVVATGLSVLGIVTLVPVWRERTWSLGRRLRHTTAVALFVLLVATLLQWNAIGFRYY
ncbi:MAG TPA: serine hydrolase domain-containing protein [Steroidobacteraceae bacterium]|nr:serine hydrolase domain-containing protein [Steroidobacteraceae bacterium]